MSGPSVVRGPGGSVRSWFSARKRSNWAASSSAVGMASPSASRPAAAAAFACWLSAALALLGSVVTATGLGLPDAELREASARTNEAIERQVAESTEVAELVRALEQQYDTAAETSGADGNPDAGAGLLGEGESIPTADELAAQFERFLAENQGRIDPPGPRTTDGPDT